MAIIDSNGLFLGDRLAWCSDSAQLHWPRLYSAANNYARLELNYRQVLSRAYANFRKPPSEKEFWDLIREYQQNFLLFIYKTQDGVLWGQWQTNERYLLGYKNADDRRSPSPPQEMQEKYRLAYIEEKSRRCQSNHGFTDLLEVVPTSSECSGLPVVGVGVGEGVGVGKKQKPSRDKREVDNRHVPFRLAVETYAKHKGVEFLWDASEAKQLSLLLAAGPTLTLAQFQTCLNHRARSPGTPHGERPRVWLPNILRYQQGPLNEFNRTEEARNGIGKGKTESSIDALRQYHDALDRKAQDYQRDVGEAGYSTPSETGPAGLLRAG